MRRIFHRIQVIQIAKELIETMDARQELVLVAKMVLPELAGRVAHRLQNRGRSHRLGRYADRRSSLADGSHSRADRQFAHDEVRAARRATRLSVIVGEQHALLGHLVEVRRPPGHQTAVVSADVPHADVVSHDDKNVRLLRLRRTLGHSGRQNENQDRYCSHGPSASIRDYVHPCLRAYRLG